MKVLRLLVTFGFAAGGLAGSQCLAEEAAGDLDSVLAKWEEASQKCQSLDANLTVFHYDDVFSDRPTIMQGRFYYEAPNKGRYEIREGSPAGLNDWSHISEAIIWTGDEMLWIDGSQRTCRRFSVAELPKLDQLPTAAGGRDYTSSGPSGFFARIISLVYRRMCGPKGFMPLVTDIRAAEVHERFSVTMARTGDEIQLKELPKRSSDAANYIEIDAILNPKTYMTYAIQVISPGGKERVVCVLNDEKINQRPADRDRLLNPELFGLRVQVLDTAPRKSLGK